METRTHKRRNDVVVKRFVFFAVFFVLFVIEYAALAVTGAAIANIERTDDQTLAEIQARDLAQHISDMGQRDPETLTRAANLIKGTRPNIMSVRVWKLSQSDFIEVAGENGSAAGTRIQ